MQTILHLAAAPTPFIEQQHDNTDTQTTPRKRFIKDLIAVGDYAHPEKQWSLHVTPDRLDKWVQRFNAARANGIDFEVTLDHSPSARSVVGYLTSLFREGDRLMGVHEFIGEEAIEIAQRVKNVSVEIDPDFVDGKGNHYGEAIVKSSLVQQPVVPGQLAFTPLPERIAERIAASRSGGDDEGSDALDEHADDVADRLRSLVKLGRLTPHCGGLLEAALTGEPGRRPGLLLSRRQSNTPRSLARMIVDAIEQNEPVTLAAATGVQTIELSRAVPGAGDENDDAESLVRSRVDRHNERMPSPASSRGL
jgi:hypothetical protein